jgi:outer membrane biosynthesis protein TonB
MKNIFLVLSTTILFASCSQKPTANEQAEAEVKATEMQELQSWKEELATQPEIPVTEEKTIEPTVAKKQPVTKKKQPVYSPEPVKNNNTTPAPQDNSTAQTSSSGQAETSAPASQPAEPAAKEKTGISNTAKGAIIGGVVGAGTGAVVNKKNRAAGAVVGGLVGAGTGAVIGNIADKKEQQKQ